MNVKLAHIVKGHLNRPGTKLSAIKAIVIHYTQNDNPGATDTMNAKYIGRGYTRKEVNGKMQSFEADGVTPFRFGSAHIFCDMDSVTEAIPTDEVAWGCGDKHHNGGYQRIAETVFKYRQNYETVDVEICNNDVIKGSDEDWNKSVANAQKWVIDFLNSHKLHVDVEGSLNPQQLKTAPAAGNVLILMHYDITGKMCPALFVQNTEAWKQFVQSIAAEVQA